MVIELLGRTRGPPLQNNPLSVGHPPYKLPFILLKYSQASTLFSQPQKAICKTVAKNHFFKSILMQIPEKDKGVDLFTNSLLNNRIAGDILII